MGLVGWPLEIVALLLAPLTVVRAVLGQRADRACSGLGLTRLGEAPGRREAIAVVAIVAGVAGVAWAAPERTTDHADTAAIALALGLVAIPIVGAVLRCGAGPPRRDARGDQRRLRLRWTAIASKLLTDELATGAVLVAIAWLATAAALGGAGAAQRDERPAAPARVPTSRR